MMAAILNSAMLDSDFCHLGFRHLVIFSQIHSKTLFLHSESDSNQFILIHLMMTASWILPSWICHLGFSLCIVEFRHLVFFLTDSLKNTLPPLWLWLKLIQSDSNSFILTQLDDGSHLEFCHLVIQPPKFRLLRFAQKNILTPLWL